MRCCWRAAARCLPLPIGDCLTGGHRGPAQPLGASVGNPGRRGSGPPGREQPRGEAPATQAEPQRAEPAGTGSRERAASERGSRGGSGGSLKWSPRRIRAADGGPRRRGQGRTSQGVGQPLDPWREG